MVVAARTAKAEGLEDGYRLGEWGGSPPLCPPTGDTTPTLTPCPSPGSDQRREARRPVRLPPAPPRAGGAADGLAPRLSPPGHPHNKAARGTRSGLLGSVFFGDNPSALGGLVKAVLPLISASTPGLHCEILPVHTPLCKGLHCTPQIPCASTTVRNVLHTPCPLCKHNARQTGHPRTPPYMHHCANRCIAHPRPPRACTTVQDKLHCTPPDPLHVQGTHSPVPTRWHRAMQPRAGQQRGHGPGIPSSPCPVPPAPATAKFSRGPALAQRAAHLAPRRGRLGPRQARRDRSRRG